MVGDSVHNPFQLRFLTSYGEMENVFGRRRANGSRWPNINAASKGEAARIKKLGWEGVAKYSHCPQLRSEKFGPICPNEPERIFQAE